MMDSTWAIRIWEEIWIRPTRKQWVHHWSTQRQQWTIIVILATLSLLATRYYASIRICSWKFQSTEKLKHIPPSECATLLWLCNMYTTGDLYMKEIKIRLREYKLMLKLGVNLLWSAPDPYYHWASFSKISLVDFLLGTSLLLYFIWVIKYL